MGRKPWHSGEWRKNRTKLIEGKSCEWCGSKETLVVHHFYRARTNEEYKSLKYVVILCKRCHFAYHKGMVLCKVCKQNYHKPLLHMCWKCYRASHARGESDAYACVSCGRRACKAHPQRLGFGAHIQRQPPNGEVGQAGKVLFCPKCYGFVCSECAKHSAFFGTRCPECDAKLTEYSL